MSWEAVVGQEEAVAVLAQAAAHREAMTHAWLITGPPGSGRSVAARAFAAALQSQGDPDSHAARTAFAGTHADVRVHRSEKLIIAKEEATALVDLAQQAPSTGAWRILIVEDADRISERTSNVLLKAVEEPPERTVWILCAPSPIDLLPTIRSRCRQVNLRIPPAQAVADLLVRRDGVEPELALTCALAAQSHIGVARRLALHEDARAYREQVLRIPGRIRGVGDAVLEAGGLIDAAKEQSKAATDDRDAAERAAFLQSSGIDADGRIPPGLRSQLNHLEEEQKRRARRSLLDTLDRALVDLLSLYRDVITVQLGAEVGLINVREESQVRELAGDSTAEQTLRRMRAITRTRDRFAEFTSIAPQLALESLFIALRPQG
ncbi:DNA polymerase III subunit delta' [Pseudactinotalea sp. HY160]|uniref:DNA polymerase III subunit delta' n=1 Tax=Pseudactinotalea sp. HY160 TaxID=2654490 RepID=UPI00128B8E97|nr:DNA polymerase III subunit delta' [Pseudactinotalea sp. HY160]MPV48928.1 DNA polymerase III subunit delta' [Pseudactinotalea sp. HY160]